MSEEEMVIAAAIMQQQEEEEDEEEEERMAMEEEEAAMAEEEEGDDTDIYESAEFEQAIQEQMAKIRVSPSEMKNNIDTQGITAKSKAQIQRYLK